MKDITRVHIAKVPYSVELAAKKQLEKYIAELEAYTNDSELLEDIEIRITELLLERGIKQEDVISEADVKAVRQQLGEPKDFMTDETTLEVDPGVLTNEASHKLYRNLDTALLGGVLSGVASFFKINPLWVRLAFIVLSFISLGLFVLLYIVLWLVIPAARTAAEKLQLAGRPVTLTSIRELNEIGSPVDVERRGRIQKRVATTILGIASVGGALVAIAALVAVTVTLVRDGRYDEVAVYQMPIILAYSAGILLAILFLLAAFAAFTQKFNKRIWMSGIIIIVLGMGAITAAGVTGAYQGQMQYQEILRNTVDTTIKTPDSFNTVTSITVDVPNAVSVVYIVDDSVTSIKQRSLKTAPKAEVTVEAGVLKLKLANSDKLNRAAENTVTVYGPRLDNIIVTSGYMSYNAGTQASLSAQLNNDASLRLVGSRIDALVVKTDDGSQFSADEAAIATVKASIYGHSSVSLGNIKTLEVTNPDVCAANQAAQLSVQNSVDTGYTHNGVISPAISREGPCLSVQFGTERMGMSGYWD